MTLYPFVSTRKSKEDLLEFAEMCFEANQWELAEQLMWVWLLRWAGAPA